METTEFHTGQKVTIFRRYPNQHFCINDKVGQIGTISNMWYYPDTDTHYAEVQLEDGSSEWFPTQMLELTPTLDQIKDVTKNFSRVSVYVEVWPRDFDGISHKLEFEWCDGMKSSALRDQINRFIDKMEKM